MFPLVMLVVHGLLGLLKREKRKHQEAIGVLKSVKALLQWSYVFRAFIMTFFATALSTFSYFIAINEEVVTSGENAEVIGTGNARRLLSGLNDRYPSMEVTEGWQHVSTFLKICALSAFTVLSSLFLVWNFQILGSAQIHSKYSTLYHNFRPHKRVLIVLGLFFCLRRMLLALFTVAVNEHILPSLLIYFYGSIFVVSLGFTHKPLEGSWHNWLENINELFIMITGYFMFFFSEWIGDVQVRYEYGAVYVELLHAVIIVNMLAVFGDLLKMIRRSYRKRIYEIKCANALRYKEEQIDILLAVSNVTIPEEV